MGRRKQKGARNAGEKTSKLTNSSKKASQDVNPSEKEAEDGPPSELIGKRNIVNYIASDDKQSNTEKDESPTPWEHRIDKCYESKPNLLYKDHPILTWQESEQLRTVRRNSLAQALTEIQVEAKDRLRKTQRFYVDAKATREHDPDYDDFSSSDDSSASSGATKKKKLRVI